MAYPGSRKASSRGGGRSDETGSPIGRFLKRPLVTVFLGIATGLLAVAVSVWLFSTVGEADSPDGGAAGDSVASETSPTSGPRIELGTESIDLGRIEQNDQVDRLITFTNAGDETLVVRDVDAS